MLRAVRPAIAAALPSAAPRKAAWPELVPAVALGGIRGIKKYTRSNFLARGEDGLHTMNDPRIFKPGQPRKYPYHKIRRWSKPYMCTDFSNSAPHGAAVKLAISYVPYEGAEVYYKLRRALERALPGSQIIAGPLQHEDGLSLEVTRVNDGRVLLALKPGRDADALKEDIFTELVDSALDAFTYRFGVGPASDLLAVDVS
eukprot:NODE_20171_length_809_cov_9.162757.p1 GENE.NODE_20171_length_809_cov_9.162757~~NODE_20171_length_809_cov_9.162757.p1  ORF type:complete len:200 (-),score=35.59 NODE_20171_length_809_cov_9.162757:140-739(-)